jgi:hypothetical protein
MRALQPPIGVARPGGASAPFEIAAVSPEDRLLDDTRRENGDPIVVADFGATFVPAQWVGFEAGHAERARSSPRCSLIRLSASQPARRDQAGGRAERSVARHCRMRAAAFEVGRPRTRRSQLSAHT